MITRFLLLLLSAVAVHLVEIDFNFQDKTSEGERRYGELVKKARSYGDCWKEAMSDLHLGCKRLTEEVQSRLALSFANCFLLHAGLDSCPCAPDVPISNCLKRSSDRIFSTYTEFFTHTQSICHYLQHREWQEEAARTVMVLTENSQAVSRKLDESSKSQSKILDLQHAALSEQKRLISNGRVLNAELQRSRESARDIYNEFKMTTHEQKLLLFEVFDRMKNLQNFVLGEFTGVYTVAYYVIAAALIYILTSVPRTAEARIWLILIIFFSAVLERILTTYTLQKDILEVNPMSASGLLYYRIWLCRKIVCSVCFIILIVSYYRYKDYNVINNELLREIQQQNIDLQNFIKGLTFHGNIQNFSTVLKSSTKHSSLLFEATKEGKIVLNTSSSGSEPNINIKNKSHQHISSPENLENKENIYFTSTPTSDLICNFKKTSRTKTASQKKSTYVKSRGNTPKISVQETSILSELESPISKRYNLRSSSRLNSPQLSPYEGKLSKDASPSITTVHLKDHK